MADITTRALCFDVIHARRLLLLVLFVISSTIFYEVTVIARMFTYHSVFMCALFIHSISTKCQEITHLNFAFELKGVSFSIMIRFFFRHTLDGF